MSSWKLAQRREADQALAGRDTRIPALNCVLDDGALSALLGESVRITRIRYKPETSALVSFRRELDEADAYGWAVTLSPDSNSKLLGRADHSGIYGEGIHLLHPDPLHADTIVAVGSIEDDWPLRKNLYWLRDQGLERLGVSSSALDRLADSPATVLRYKPERRLVVRISGIQPIVVKTAVQPYDAASRLQLRRRLLQHGVPVLPELADGACARHGISASPAWGGGDLGGSDNADAAYRAGEALAAIHGVEPVIAGDAAEDVKNLVRQLMATRSMIAAILPQLEEPAATLTGRLLTQISKPDWHSKPVLVHGDFSPDQILVDDSAVRIIDFDRSHTSDPAADIGSFAATEEIAHRGPAGLAGGRKTGHLIDGYKRAGRDVSLARVDIWAAFRLFLSSVDPFRDRSENWPADTQWHIDRALELTT